MRDAERRLLRCIGWIDNELILEADSARFRPRRWGHLAALAACLALVLALPFWLNARSKREASPQDLQGNKTAEMENIPAENIFDTTDHEPSLGGLILGMTQAEVQERLGDPASVSGTIWNYDGLKVGFFDYNQTVRAIQATEGCTLALESGISVGSPEADVPAAYPSCETGTEADGSTYYLFTGSNQLLIRARDGVVYSIDLINLGDPMLESLSVPEITIYTWSGKVWETTTVTNKAAKGICTVLTISEPDVPTAEKTQVSQWMDFGNGTAVELYGDDHASIYTYSDTFDPERVDGMTWRLSGQFPMLDQYVAEALADPDAAWDEAPEGE